MSRPQHPQGGTPLRNIAHHPGRSARLSTLLCLALSGAGLAIPALAQNTLPAVNVVADDVPPLRPDRQADSLQNPYRVPTSNRAGVEVFTSDDIRNLQPRDVFDLLDKATGVNITYQGRKNPFFVKERGGGSFTYVIDGVILPTVTQRILQRIPLAAIEELQVVRDSTALTLGPLINIGASGSGDGLNTGFIIIRTRQPEKDEVRVTAAVEKAVNQPTANSESLYAGKRIGGPANTSELSAHLAAFVSNFNRPSKDDWFDGQDGRAQMARAGLGNERWNVNLVGFSESGRFEMQRGINPTTGALDTSKWFYDPAQTDYQAMNSTVNWNANQSTLFTLFGTRYHQTESDASFASAATTVSNYDEGTSGLSLVHNARFGDTYLHGGYQRTHSYALGASGPTPNTRWDTRITGYAVTVEQRLLNDKLFLDLGYRRDEKSVATTDTTARMNGVDLPAAKALSLGGRWLITPVYAVNARYFDGDQGSAAGNFSLRPLPGTTLDPEQQKRKELALEGRFSPALFGQVTFFDVDIRNQKVQSSTAYTYAGQQYYYYSETNARRTGYELLVKGSLADRTTYKASWTHMTRNISSNASVTSQNPDNTYDATLSHGLGDYTLNFSVKRVDSYLGSNAGSLPVATIGGFTRVDANVIRDFRWAKADWSATLYGRNLTNRHYVTQEGPTGLYPDRGRTLGVQLTAVY